MTHGLLLNATFHDLHGLRVERDRTGSVDGLQSGYVLVSSATWWTSCNTYPVVLDSLYISFSIS